MTQTASAFASTEKSAIANLGGKAVTGIGNAVFRETDDIYVLHGSVEIVVKALASAPELLACGRALV
jgi:hypothetical protein